MKLAETYRQIQRCKTVPELAGDEYLKLMKRYWGQGHRRQGILRNKNRTFESRRCDKNRNLKNA